MQAVFLDDDQKVKSFVATLSKARLAKYMKEAGGNTREALILYHWNSQLSQALYLPLQSWEIGLRNKMNTFLCWKYNAKWPYDNRAIRAFAKPELEKLTKTIQRQTQDRKVQPSTDQIVADLSAGFWVSLLGNKYSIPFSWRYNLTAKIFTNDARIDQPDARDKCAKLLDLRNRVAHHEPIFHLDLEAIRTDLDTVLGGLCGATQAYMVSACSFASVWAARPAVGGELGQLTLGQT